MRRPHCVVIATAAVIALGACGSSSAVTAPSPTPVASPVPSPTADVAAASSFALTIFYAPPNQTPGVWVPCSSRASAFADCPFTPQLKTRLTDLGTNGYFGDAPPASCAEDYITGTQNGLFKEPTVVSAVAAYDGSVTVVIRRGPPPPDLTVTMTLDNGNWLASDLASGSGPSASIFSTKPNC